MCRDLVLRHAVGHREAATARESIFDLADRLRGRVQLTTHGFGAYPKAVMDAFAGDVDYAGLIKLSGEPKGLRRPSAVTPPAFAREQSKGPVFGNPDPEKVSTPPGERKNLSFTRFASGFSKGSRATPRWPRSTRYSTDYPGA
jgi:hypothetical protein